MEFRTPLEEEREQVEALWAYCFEPKGNPFFEWYFSNCYEPENIIVGVENGQVLADLHLRQYRLSIRDTELPVTYIVGVATHPAARRGGAGRDLLRASMKELQRRGQGISILMPSKAAFYQQYGWDLYCHQWVETMPLEELRPLTDRTLQFGLLNEVDQWTLLAPIYEAYTQGQSGYSVRSEKDWRRLLGSLFNEGARVAIVHDGKGAAEGYLIYTLGAPEIMVSELVYTTRRGQRGLLNYLYNHRSQGETVRWNEGSRDQGYIFWPNGKTGHSTMPFMMSRIVDVKTAVEALPIAAVPPVKRLRFAVTDPLCDWNEGTYDLILEDGMPGEGSDSTGPASGGRLRVARVADQPAADGDVKLAVGALGLLLIGRMTASELRFEGKLEGSAAAITALDMMYPKRDTFINEWW